MSRQIQIEFADALKSRQSFAFVSSRPNRVLLSLAVMTYSDIDLCLDLDSARRIAGALSGQATGPRSHRGPDVAGGVREPDFVSSESPAGHESRIAFHEEIESSPGLAVVSTVGDSVRVWVDVESHRDLEVSMDRVTASRIAEAVLAAAAEASG